MSASAVSTRTVGTRLALVATGHFGKFVEEVVVDRAIYAWVTFYFVTYYAGIYGEDSWLSTAYGGLTALVVMLPVTAALCLIYIWAYDKLKQDIFGFESIKELKDTEDRGLMKRVLRWLARRSDVLVFFFLACWKDAFMTTVYLRKGSYNGLSRRDWKVFWPALLVSNAWWALMITGFVTIVTFVFNLLPEPWKDVLLAAYLWLTRTWHAFWDMVASYIPLPIKYAFSVFFYWIGVVWDSVMYAATFVGELLVSAVTPAALGLFWLLTHEQYMIPTGLMLVLTTAFALIAIYRKHSGRFDWK